MSDYVLKMKGIDKRFGGIHALRGVDLSVRRGEVLGLVGENGAGKSTLMKILAGAVLADAGTIAVNGQDVAITDPARAHDLGIKVIYQEFTLVPERSVAENVFLGQIPLANRAGFVDFATLYRETARLLHSLGIDVDPRKRVGAMGIAEQQLVEIAKAFFTPPIILVMDEPTAALSSTETQRLFDLIRRWKERGVAVVFISHRLEEIREIADRVTVLRDGSLVGTLEKTEADVDKIIKMMVGRELSSMFPKADAEIGDVVLSVRGLTVPGRCRDVSFDLHKGEILGLSGLMGAGRTDVVRSLFGATRAASGEIKIDGQLVHVQGPDEAIKLGMGFVPEDRKGQGMIPALSVADNITLSSTSQGSRLGFLDFSSLRALVEPLVKALRIVTFNPFVQKVSQLSGGNQQKAVIARGLAAKARILIVDEPTRGVDVGAKAEIHRLLGEYVKQGNSVIMVSSELPEVLGTSDRVLVMHEGRVSAVLDRSEATEETIMKYAVGGGNHR